MGTTGHKNSFANAPAPLSDYYRILVGGIDAYNDGRDLLLLVADSLDFEGPIAGKLTGATRFAQGVKGFISNVQSIDPIQLVATDTQAATLYDAHLPGGVVRFSEFFTLSDGTILALRIQYDPADYMAKGGR
jgi:hypothetical protein